MFKRDCSIKRNYFGYFFRCDKALTLAFVFCSNNIYSTIYCNVPMKYDKMEEKMKLA